MYVHLFCFITLIRFRSFGLDELCWALCFVDEMYVLSASNKRVSVELVGKEQIQDKLSCFEELTSASTSYLGVSSPGDPCEIGAVVPSKFD